MANDTSNVKIDFGRVAFPYSVEDALVESASYRPDERVENVKASLSGLKRYFDKHTPKAPKNNEDDTVTALLKLIKELKGSDVQEDESAQKGMK